MSRPRRAQVVLVGRPNVGKSTLFNRLTGARRAIVTPIPGTTRDVITHAAEWRGFRFDLTDTGGLFGASEDPLHALVVERGHRALKSADLIVFVTDGREGLVSGDQEIASSVRATGRPAVMAINKADDRRSEAGTLELYRLGFEPAIEISAEHGRGIGDLLDAVIEKLPRGSDRATDAKEDDDEEAGAAASQPRETAIAIVGRPNAGKSSLVNVLLREERMIVSPVPGTTRDSVDSMLTWHRRQFRIVDTAGIRKPGRVARSGQVEALSVMLARRAIERADVVVLVIDATVGPTDQDAAIAGAAQEAGRGVIIVANKWDLMKSHGPEGAKVFDQTVRDHLKFLDYVPILHVSSQTGERTGKVLETVDKVTIASRIRVPTGELNRFIRDLTAASPPITESKRRHVRVLYAAQPSVAPPTFVLFTNVSATLHFSYLRFLENRLREKYEFFGTPIRIVVRGRPPRVEEGAPDVLERRRRTARARGRSKRSER